MADNKTIQERKDFLNTEDTTAEAEPVMNITMKNIEVTVNNETYTIKRISAASIPEACVELEGYISEFVTGAGK